MPPHRAANCMALTGMVRAIFLSRFSPARWPLTTNIMTTSLTRFIELLIGCVRPTIYPVGV